MLVAEILGDRFVDNFVFLPTQGTRGGILVAVDGDFYIKEAERRVHSVTAKNGYQTGMVEWCITSVYGPQEDHEKLQFLGKLRWIQHIVTDKWLVLGDFNMILQARDKSNSNLNKLQCAPIAVSSLNFSGRVLMGLLKWCSKPGGGSCKWQIHISDFISSCRELARHYKDGQRL